MKNKKSLFKTLLILFIIKYTVLGVLFFAGAKKYIHSANVDLFVHELNSNAKIIMPSIKESVAMKNYEALSNTVNSIAADSNKRITVIDVSGNILADSQNDASAMQNHLNRDEVKEVVDGKPFAKSLRYSSTLHENMLYMALPVHIDGNLAAILRVSVPIQRINLFTNAIFNNMAAIFILIAALALAAAYLISRKVSSGISQLNKAALEVASGNLGAKVNINSNDEVGSLAVSFNKMSDDISNLFNEVNEGKEMLDKVLSSVSTGIILADADSKTLLFNDAFKNMFPDAQKGRYFWEFLRSREIENAIKQIKTDSGADLCSGEFSSGAKIFSFAVSKVKNEDKFVISAEDLTKVRELDNLKKDFVANASHELKTPVTAIIGFSETLEAEELSQESRHYVGIIKKQAQRLSNVIKDLISLSSFENIKNVEKSEVNIVYIIDNVAGFYKKKAAEKNIKIRVSVSDGLYDIIANEFNMEQLLVNLVDNAVKYTEKGEITISAENAGEFVSLSVSDTGIGIPKEHIPRLFERFYVVDKSRSRKSGGTGLGLSIVKHIVNSHNGSITIESSENTGTKFEIKIPAKLK